MGEQYLGGAGGATGWTNSEGDKPVVNQKAKAVVLIALPDPDHGPERSLKRSNGDRRRRRQRTRLSASKPAGC